MIQSQPERVAERNRREKAGAQPLPGVFLMTNNFETGGSERQFAALAQSLDPASFRLHLGCIQQVGPFLEGLGEVPQFRLGGSLYGWKSLRTRYRLTRHLRRCDITIAHAFDFYTNLTMIPAARMARVPVVIGSQRQLGDLLSPAQSRAQAAVFRWCDKVVCNSQAAADRLVARGLRESRVVVIGNGLPATAFAETPPAMPRGEGILRVGMIARMNALAKNHRSFLLAVAQLRSRFPEAEFLLVGDGPLRPELERYADELGIRDKVNFLGNRRDIPAVLASMDISVQPSASESLSNVIIESMAAGVPVVANRVGGNVELVTDDRGILVAPDPVEPDDGQALAKAIDRLLQDAALRAKLGRNARQFAQANFTLEQMRKRHEELYAELLEKKQWRPSQRVTSYTGASPGHRLRLAIVAPSLRYVGGQSVQADLLLRNWQDDPDVQAWLIPVDPRFPRGLRWAEQIPVLRTIVREPFYLLALWRGLKGADIAHIFSASYWSFLIAPVPAWLVARLRGKKTLVHYHSGEARDHLRRFRMARPLLKRADQLVVPSGYLVEVFREFGLPAQAVPNIVDLSQFTFRLRNPIRPHLVCTRGFHPYYCVDLAVRAFAEVAQAFPDARFDLVGGGPSEPQIHELVSGLNLVGVDFKGVASRQEIGRRYDAADIFINASRLDNMPVSILEAFASGTPVVSTAPEGMRFLVEHERTGLLSDPGDVRGLAQNVIRVLRDPELASRLACNALEESRRYRWTAVREQWLDVYRSLKDGDGETVQELVAVGDAQN
jgi:glycosyltransferase involved in cell wall biosynthesis